MIPIFLFYAAGGSLRGPAFFLLFPLGYSLFSAPLSLLTDFFRKITNNLVV
jgi:hypothetical protein